MRSQSADPSSRVAKVALAPSAVFEASSPAKKTVSAGVGGGVARLVGPRAPREEKAGELRRQ